ncbi:MAG: GNAT family N-acetyltransferase [Candidatus Paceibacterota bacterium]
MYDKLIVLSKKMKSEKALLGGQLEVASLWKALQEERAEFIIQDGEIIAFGALWPREHSIELGSMWVAAGHRGHGFGSIVFSHLIARSSINIRLFLITYSPLVTHLALKNGMREADRENWMRAIPWSASCEPCDRLPEADKPLCPFRAIERECRLFFKV